MRFNNLKTHLSSTSVQVQVVESTGPQFFLESKTIVLQRFFHFQRGLRQDFGITATPSEAPVIATWTSTTTKVSTGYSLVKVNHNLFCLGFWTLTCPRTPAWSTGVGGALCSNRWSSDPIIMEVWYQNVTGQVQWVTSTNCRPLVQTGWIFRSVFFFVYIGIKTLLVNLVKLCWLIW